MKRVVSVSLGSSTRNKESEVELLGETFHLERIGVDGDMAKFAAMFKDLDGKVDAMGIGGADLYVVSGSKKFAFREIKKAVSGATQTPVVDGSGLKHTLERETIRWIQKNGVLDFQNERAILMSAVDRYGMAQTLAELCPDVIFGDLMFGVGLPIPIRTYRSVNLLANILLPVITQLPFKWFYPTGAKQEERKPSFGKFFADRTVICGDSLYILRYAPDSMPGATIITQSVRKANIEWFQKAGVRQIITTTPVIGGETFATNVMEAALVASLGLKPEQITEQTMIDALHRLEWTPNVLNLGTFPTS